MILLLHRLPGLHLVPGNMSWLRRRRRPPADVDEPPPPPPQPKQRRLLRRRTPIGDPPPTCITQADFHDGEILEKYAHHTVTQGILTAGRPSAQGELLLASVCSGSEVLSPAMAALSSELRRQGMHLSVKVQCVCEVDQQKREWCMNVQNTLHPPEETNDMCVFTDVTQFIDSKDGTAFCERHGKPCPLPERLDGVIGGPSCKDFSKANAGRQKSGTVASAQTSPGKSADTIRGLLAVVDLKLPEFILIENVDTMDDGTDASGLDHLLSELGSRGYDSQPYMVDAADFALPQSRKRLFVISVLSPGRRCRVKNYSKFFKDLGDMLKTCKLGGPDLLGCMLPDSHQYIRHELLARRSRGPARGWDSSTIDVHRKEWGRTGLRWQASQAKEEDRDSDWFPTLHARQRDILAYSQHMNRAPASSVKAIGVDLGQSIGRAPTTTRIGGKLCCPTIMPGSLFWVSTPDSEQDRRRQFYRPLVGLEGMMFQGWPVMHPRWAPLLAKYENSLKQSLAGNAFAGTVVLSLMTCLLFTLEWNEDAPHTWADEVYTDREVSESAVSLLSAALGQSSRGE